MYKGLCVLNMKGGVGKTTVAVNLGWAAAAAGLKCLVVDLDPQFNASVYLMGTGAYENHITSGGLTVFDIFEEHTPMRDPQRARPSGDNVIYTSVRASYRYKGEVHVIPSQLELAMTLKNPSGKSHLLSTFLSQHASNYDLVIVDPPPTRLNGDRRCISGYELRSRSREARILEFNWIPVAGSVRPILQATIS